jgi:hypothetical protein
MKEIEILLSFLPSLLIALYFMHQLTPITAIVYALIIFSAMELSIYLASKLFLIDIDFIRWVDGIVFSVVLTGFASAMGAALPIFLLPVAAIEPHFTLKKPMKKLTSYDIFRFAIMFALITALILVALSILTLFIGGYAVSSRILGGMLISFFISYLPVSQKLIGVRLLYARPNGYFFEELMFSINAIIAYFSVIVAGIILLIDLAIIWILIKQRLL